MERKKTLFKSLAAFQQEVPAIHKGTTGYGYSYADLPTIFEVINPLLKKHDLGFTQSVNGSQLYTRIFHVDTEEFIESSADIPQGVSLAKMNDFQVLGSAITYMRRYQLSAMLGLITDVDNDAHGQQVAKSEPKSTDITSLVKQLGECKSQSNLNLLKTTASKLKPSMSTDQIETVANAIEEAKTRISN